MNSKRIKRKLMRVYAVIDRMRNANKSWIEKNRQKWSEIPAGHRHFLTATEISDDDLILLWEKAFKDSAGNRRWYRNKYLLEMQNKNVLDIGCGLALDSLYWLQGGANVMFCDIIKENVDVVRRLCNLFNIKAEFYYLKKPTAFMSTKVFDYILFLGVIHHSPFKVMKEEIATIIQ